VTFTHEQIALARRVLARCRERGERLVTAESCTGGLIAACLTEIAGSSEVFDRGFVTYDDRAKRALLGVSAADLERSGAVSEVVARAMAAGALVDANAQRSVAVTGIAGPGGGTADKPVGTVHIASACASGAIAHERHLFAGDRSAVRAATLSAALSLLLRAPA
jgi:nicotinamide-nucleotide amidase